jgi:ketosteroid isomerase-like protein
MGDGEGEGGCGGEEEPGVEDQRTAFSRQPSAIGFRHPAQIDSALLFPYSLLFKKSRTVMMPAGVYGGLMRDLVLLVGVIATLAVLAIGQDAGDAARTAIRKVIDEQQAAWNRQDLEAFMAGYWNSPELTFFSGAHEAKGWQAALDRYKKNYQGAGREMGKLEFANLRIEMLGPESAFVRGEFHLTMSDGKTPHGLFTLVFRKFPEGWKIVHDHSAGE